VPFIPTHIKQLRTTAPKDMKAAKQARVKARAEARARKEAKALETGNVGGHDKKKMKSGRGRKKKLKDGKAAVSGRTQGAGPSDGGAHAGGTRKRSLERLVHV
jgi:hypothetical protein